MEVIDEVNGLEKCLKLGMTHFQSFSDVPEHLQKRYQKFLFPPTPEEAEWMHLGKLSLTFNITYYYHNHLLLLFRTLFKMSSTR